jgi:hypothetical protein
MVLQVVMDLQEQAVKVVLRVLLVHLDLAVQVHLQV